MPGCSERQKEIKRRRHRRKKMTKLTARLEKASGAEKLEIARKIRALTPGSEELITRLKLES
jgi:hypothetical protein